MATHKDAERWTGLQTGGISALALLHKKFPVYIDRSALDLPRILISAGKRGVNLELTVADLLKITKATAIAAT
jgi:Cys-tRNA(Pro)/Cys-tRNA(Cys) deacylase